MRRHKQAIPPAPSGGTGRIDETDPTDERNQGITVQVSALRQLWSRLNRPLNGPIGFGGSGRAAQSGIPLYATGSSSADGGQRGVALLVVLTMMVLFTAFVADFAYEARVRYTLASHARDELRAQILAENGIKQFRMLLEVEKPLLQQVQKQPMAQAFLSAMGLTPNQSIIVQLTRSMPMPCDAVKMLSASGGGDESSEDSGAAGGEDSGGGALSMLLGGGSETCQAKAELEANKLYGLKGLKNNIQGVKHPQVERLVQLFEGEEFKGLLRDANLEPEELACNIADWADADSMRCYKNAGYEDDLYSRGDDPYKSKNRDFDTVGELRLVAGMNDAIFAKLAPMVTVWEKLFVLPITNCDYLGVVTELVTVGKWQNTAANRPSLCSGYNTFVSTQLGGMYPMDKQGLIAALSAGLGVMGNALVEAEIDKLLGTAAGTGAPGMPGTGAIPGQLPGMTSGGAAQQKNPLPTVYSIMARAKVGDVTRSARVVIDTSSTPSKLLYWRLD